MRLFVLQSHHLSNRLFLHAWSASVAQVKEPSLVIYEVNSINPQDQFFLGKRLAALLSESMVPAIAISNTQKLLLSYDSAEQLVFHGERLLPLFAQSRFIVLGSAIPRSDTPTILQPTDCLKALTASNLFTYHHLFVKNDLSPLANPARLISSEAERIKLTQLFPEEESVLDLAKFCLPCIISTARNFHAHG